MFPCMCNKFKGALGGDLLNKSVTVHCLKISGATKVGPKEHSISLIYV